MSDQPAQTSSPARSSENATTSNNRSAQLDPQSGQPLVPPLDPPLVPIAIAGLSIWAVAGLIALGSQNWLAHHGHSSWLGICVAGFVIGIPGLLAMVRHDAHRSARRTSKSNSDQRIRDKNGHTTTG